MEVIAIGESMVSLVNEPSGYIRHADTFKPFVAGAETNTLIGLSRLGHTTSWVSALGSDELGELILHNIRAEGIDTSNVMRKDKRTGVFFKQISPDGSVDVTYYRENSAASYMSIEDIDLEVMNSSKILYLTGITLSLSTSVKKMLFELVKQIQEGITVILDPNIRLKMWTKEEARATILSFLPYVDCLIIGKNEMNILFETDDYKKAFNKIKNYGCDKIILKLGKDGVVYDFENDKGQIDNPRQFEEIDPVGAGDAFAAGVVSGILKGEEPKNFLKKACFLGGYITQFIGDYQGFPNETMIESALLKDNDEKVNR